MIALFKKLFTKNTPSKPLLRVGQAISTRNIEKAKLTVSSEEVFILSDMWLICQGEKEDRIHFRVAVNYHPRDSKTEAKNGDEVYFLKDEFLKLKYRKH
jgi:hypothetical protein